MSDPDLFYKVYRLLDRHPLALADCGELCGKICCCYKFPQDEEDGMELIPGEEAVFPIDSNWLQFRLLTGEAYEYPPEWGSDSGCLQVRCTAPCPRDKRPVNCRLFPFQVCSIRGQYYLILTGSGLGYSCPLVVRPDLVNPDFVDCARQAAKLLLGIPKYRQLVDWDSKTLDLREVGIKYTL